ncbi:hypothetical protein [Variovorax sp. PAMC 28711]|uniref:hypothetical protein n=1 Tax=Variovorax sp. PAMC 28711 TaxID=1795631 RepID=UPI00078D77F7|nr:hypothetical protein [Variovorax sp. PAMC 28711]AMM24618.1 hypothetical protein AX767_09845 [Variovorax sp. PAMC 28711]
MSRMQGRERPTGQAAVRVAFALAVACGAAVCGLGPALAQSAAPKRDASLAALPMPIGAKVEIIAPYMRFNDSPMQISRIETDDLAAVEKFYRDYFAAKGEDGVVSDVTHEGRRLLSAIVDKRLITVEMLPERSGHSVLVSSLMPMRLQAPEKLAKDMPRLPGTVVLQVLESVEAVGSNVTTSMRNSYSVETNAYYLRAQMLLRGWRRVRDDTIDAGKQRQIVFGKAGRQMLMDIQRIDDATLIVANDTN